ncbi:MAG: glycosyltransferase family 2 protein [Acidobacteria bacterium]|nr:glycosyltransferase family 2 protein [Acidobacteriota bacterium]
MAKITAALIYEEGESQAALVEDLLQSSAVAEVLLLTTKEPNYQTSRLKTRWLQLDSFLGAGIAPLISATTTDYLLLILPGQAVRLGARAIERFLQTAEDTGAALVYADFKDQANDALNDHPLIAYQLGSLRDSFDFGSVLLLSKTAAEKALAKHGAIDERLKFGGLYDLRLKLSLDAEILRIPEPLYTRIPTDTRASGEKQFDYVDPRQRAYQSEMEDVASAHLQRLGAYLYPEFYSCPSSKDEFLNKASVIIPVRNRERTIRDAVISALSQATTFPFNVIVVDNHSTDQTTDILAELAHQDPRLIHLQPRRHDLGIGGCWNEAVFSMQCGEYAVQLDSDDLYKDEQTLAKIIATFEEGHYAMVIGSYTIVNFELQEIPPGVIDHAEWTRDNGRNNALRINGLGAPRAFYTPLLRQMGLPNTSYGEDYATALRISRHYEIGRIYESIYYARRWEGNSDAALPIATANRYDAYKDHLRSVEMKARINMNFM